MTEQTEGYVRVAHVAELPPNSLIAVEVGDVKICLANADGQIYAFQDNCTQICGEPDVLSTRASRRTSKPKMVAPAGIPKP